MVPATHAPRPKDRVLATSGRSPVDNVPCYVDKNCVLSSAFSPVTKHLSQEMFSSARYQNSSSLRDNLVKALLHSDCVYNSNPACIMRPSARYQNSSSLRDNLVKALLHSDCVYNSNPACIMRPSARYQNSSSLRDNLVKALLHSDCVYNSNPACRMRTSVRSKIQRFFFYHFLPAKKETFRRFQSLEDSLQRFDRIRYSSACFYR